MRINTEEDRETNSFSSLVGIRGAAYVYQDARTLCARGEDLTKQIEKNGTAVGGNSLPTAVHSREDKQSE